MIGLNSGDKVQGDSTSAGKVDYSIFGYKNSVVTQMATGQLPNAIGDLYIAATADAVLSIVLVNTNATTENVNLYVLPSAGTARRLIAKDLQLFAGYSLHFDGKSVEVLNTIGQVIYVGSPGATGGQGIPGLFVPGMDAEPPEEPMMIPGPKGDIGQSANIVYIPSEQGEPGEDTFPLPIKGDKGDTGSQVPVVAAGGTADAITGVYTPTIAALTDMLRLDFVAAAANATTTPTFKADGTTAHTIVKQGGVALAVGDIKGAGMVCQIQYNLAGTRYELLNPASSGTTFATAAEYATGTEAAKALAPNILAPITNALQDNIALLAYQLQVYAGLAYFNLENGVTDEFEDETGVDTAKNVNATYDSGGDYYHPTGGGYASQYPTAQNDTYVKATTHNDADTWPYKGTDPTKSLTGNYTTGSWMADVGAGTNQRFHIDLGSAIVITKIYYENFHDSGANTNRGGKNFTFWGSNTGGDFADLTYANAGTWVQIGGALQFDQHTGSNVADPKYITVTNTTAYRYYAIKIADCWGSTLMGVRRIELQMALPYNNMTLVSNSTEANSQPTTARLLVLVEPVVALTLNTDIKGWVSEDDNSHYDQVTLTDLGVASGAIKIYAGNVNLTSYSDKTMRMKLTTLNNKNLKVHAWTLQWGG